jgi:hypothetical protein
MHEDKRGGRWARVASQYFPRLAFKRAARNGCVPWVEKSASPNDFPSLRRILPTSLPSLRPHVLSSRLSSHDQPSSCKDDLFAFVCLQLLNSISSSGSGQVAVAAQRTVRCREDSSEVIGLRLRRHKSLADRLQNPCKIAILQGTTLRFGEHISFVVAKLMRQ